jgi:putative restriction endonuclease
MPVQPDILTVGACYDRPTLARLWGMAGYQGLGRGVFTPRGTNFIVLFVTRQKRQGDTQYNDFLEDDLLFWEGEDGHGNDERLAHASKRGDEIHLFYRKQHYAPFTYHGRLVLTHFIQRADKPSEFAFKVVSLVLANDLKPYDKLPATETRIADEAVYSMAMTEAGLNSIDKEVIAKSRGMGQRFFRGSLFKLWQGQCAVTGTQTPEALKASHIKPWKDSETSEKIDPFNGLLLIPNLDTLMDSRLISFENNGQIIISPRLQESDRFKLHIHNELHLRHVPSQSVPYLEFHRAARFLA